MTQVHDEAVQLGGVERGRQCLPHALERLVQQAGRSVQILDVQAALLHALQGGLVGREHHVGQRQRQVEQGLIRQAVRSRHQDRQ